MVTSYPETTNARKLQRVRARSTIHQRHSGPCLQVATLQEEIAFKTQLEMPFSKTGFINDPNEYGNTTQAWLMGGKEISKE